MEMECPNPTSTTTTCSSSKTNKTKKTTTTTATTHAKKSSRVMKLSTDPQSVAARQRRHRISDRFKILQSMVPGGSKMDTVSMLEEAIHYVKFLKTQIWLHQTMIDENTISPLHHQQSYYPAFLDHSQQQQTLLPPLPQCCFKGEDDDVITFNEDLIKYWSP